MTQHCHTTEVRFQYSHKTFMSCPVSPNGTKNRSGWRMFTSDHSKTISRDHSGCWAMDSRELKLRRSIVNRSRASSSVDLWSGFVDRRMWSTPIVCGIRLRISLQLPIPCQRRRTVSEIDCHLESSRAGRSTSLMRDSATEEINTSFVASALRYSNNRVTYCFSFELLNCCRQLLGNCTTTSQCIAMSSESWSALYVALNDVFPSKIKTIKWSKC